MACCASKSRQHALAIPTPRPGHSNPLMRLCKRLASQEGFIITFVTMDIHHPDLQQQNVRQEILAKQGEAKETLLTIAADCIGAAVDIRRARIALTLPKPSDLAGRRAEVFSLAMESLAPEIEQLLRQLQPQDPPVTCIISDLLMTHATQKVADKLQLPRIAFNCFSQTALLLFHHILEGALPLQEVFEALAQRELLKESIIKVGLEGLPTLKVGDLIYQFEENQFCYKSLLEALEETRKNSCAMAINSFEEVEVQALKVNIGLPVYTIGPLVDEVEKDNVSSLQWKEDDSCISWLDKQPPLSVLYISFGSSATLSITQFEELVAGLLLSQQRFLWVFRQGLVKDASFSTFPEEMLSRSNGRGYAISWAPQVKVLHHPATYGFLTHCGWNSTLEALATGVPMLCFPYVSDQYMNAKLIVEEWKVGLRFKEEEGSQLVGREEVERVIKALMDGEEGKLLHKNAKHFKEACQQVCSQEGQASKNLKSLVRSLG